MSVLSSESPAQPASIRRPRAIAVAIAVLAICGAGAGVGVGVAQAAAATIRVAINSDIRSLNPGVNRDSNTDAVLMHIVEGLVAYSENGVPKPMLARTVHTSEDGTTITFKLRRDVRFHNGQVMTSAAVAWSWRRYLDPKTRWVCLPELDGSRGVEVQAVEAPDPETVVFRLSRPHPMFLTQIAAVQCGGGAILHPDSVDDGGRFVEPIGTGPYRLGSWQRGRYIELVAFADYRGLSGAVDGYAGAKIAYADQVRWMVIRDDAARRAALLKGQIDVLPWVSAPEIPELRQQPDLALKTSPTLGANVLLIQTEDDVLSDPLLRQALAHSLDYGAISEIVSAGAGAQNASMVPVVSPHHSAAHDRRHAFDPKRARQLLAQSGYRGQRIKLLTNRRYPDLFDQSLMIHSMTRQAGINVELEVLDWTAQLDRYQSGNYQLMSFAYSPRVDPCLNYEAMVGERSRSSRKVWGTARAVALLESGCAAQDPARRQAIFEQMHALMLQEIPLIVLFNPGAISAVNTRVQGFQAWPLVRERLWNVRPARAGQR